VKGQQFWVAATERDGAGRFIVRADEKLTAFVELEKGHSRVGTNSTKPLSCSVSAQKKTTKVEPRL